MCGDGMSGHERPLLRVDGLVKQFTLPRSGVAKRADVLRAVDGVSLTVDDAEVLALVGESGCGKTTLARCVLGLLRPDSGTVHFDGRDLAAMTPAELRRRRRGFQMVFQDPAASLDPGISVARQIAEPLEVHEIVPRKAIEGEVLSLLATVGLPAAFGERPPSDLSGGQLQRLSIARALATRPRLLVADEPVASLDLPARARIIRLLETLRQTSDLAVLLTTHDLAAARSLADRVCVMHAGRICESGDAAAVLSSPLHPYTAALLAAEPRLGRRITAGQGPGVSGDVNDSGGVPGCQFAPQCPIARARCRTDVVELRDVMSGRSVACHFAGEM